MTSQKTSQQHAPGEVFVPGEKHVARIWLRGGPADGFLITFDFGDQPLTAAQAATSAEVNVIECRMRGGQPMAQTDPDGKPQLKPFGTLDGGGAFFWGDIVAVRYEGKRAPERKIVLPSAAELQLPRR